ncbi:MAG: hypothetical protein IJ113_02420, partial [Eggerthellaceae bacterium]|nr:hypothetical protein [Eggerthellaceae bacterium]
MAKKKEDYSINGAPTAKVANLTAPTRASGGSHVMESKWAIASAATNAKNRKRATGQDVVWWVAGIQAKVAHPGLMTKSSSINLNSFTVGKKTYNRDSFYPNTKTKLSNVTCMVRFNNNKGAGAWAKVTRKFSKPRTPTIGTMTRNKNTGRVSCTIKTNAGQDYLERYDTRYQVFVYDSRTKKETKKTDTTSTSVEIANVGFDVGSQQALTEKDYVRITVKAWARGYAGDSSIATRTHYLAMPAKPTISKYTYSSLNENSGVFTAYIKTNTTTTHPTDSVVLQVVADSEISKASELSENMWESTNAVDNGNCTALSVPISVVKPTAGKYSWIRIQAVHDDFFTINSAPMRLTKLETPAPAEPTAADDNVWILSVTPNDDGESVTVKLGWDKNGKDDSTGTELSWATDKRAWQSTKGPKTFEFTWSDKTSQASGYRKTAEVIVEDLDMGETYHFRARRYLEGNNGTSWGQYSSYTTVVPVTAPEGVNLSPPPYIFEGQDAQLSWTFDSESPQKAWQLYTPSNAYEYKTIDTWTINNVADVLGPNNEWIQVAKPSSEYPDGVGAEVDSMLIYWHSGWDKQWMLVYSEWLARAATFDSTTGRMVPKDGKEKDFTGLLSQMKLNLKAGESLRFVLNGSQIISKDPTPDVILGSGQDPNGAYILPWNRLQSFIDEGSLVVLGRKLNCKVRISTGSEWVESDEAVLRIIDPISVGIDLDEECHYQPLEFVCMTDAPATLRVVVSALAAVGDGARGDNSQYDGDTVYSGTFAPVWTANEDETLYSSVITLPSGLDLRQDASYLLEVEAVDTFTGAVASTSATFAVNYDHRAVPPSPNITVEGVDLTDEQGVRVRKAVISLKPPEDAIETDVYDIYRVGLDEPELIAEGLPLDAEVEDLYAPFGEDCIYRVAL